MSKLAYERMRDALVQLNMPRANDSLDGLLDRAGSGELTTVDVLDQMFAQELAARRERSITTRLKLAGLPTIKTIEQFEFSFQPSLDERKVRDLHTLRFLANGENIIFLGPPGCGKTHLSISLATPRSPPASSFTSQRHVICSQSFVHLKGPAFNLSA